MAGNMPVCSRKFDLVWSTLVIQNVSVNEDGVLKADVHLSMLTALSLQEPGVLPLIWAQNQYDNRRVRMRGKRDQGTFSSIHYLYLPMTDVMLGLKLATDNPTCFFTQEVKGRKNKIQKVSVIGMHFCPNLRNRMSEAMVVKRYITEDIERARLAETESRFGYNFLPNTVICDSLLKVLGNERNAKTPVCQSWETYDDQARKS